MAQHFNLVINTNKKVKKQKAYKMVTKQVCNNCTNLRTFGCPHVFYIEHMDLNTNSCIKWKENGKNNNF